ncbi:hypothetical protein F2Q68_00004860 [Brassica cretica]|uniref:Uncharacterized protein n=1 Tax=Brassica cretica TaxID=69181 RepID=A0A8S9JLI6_BRACR|nr:hypothetical protein F2Q68_00004860 [Brassica cretica]
MVTLIDTKRGINPLRLGKGHEVQSTETRVGPTHQKGKLDGVIGPTRQMGELDGVAGPTRQMGKLDGVIDPTRPFGCLILCLEMLETSVLGLGQDLGLITALGGAMTTSTYVYRIVFDLIPSRFNVRDMFSAYVTCMDVFTQIAKDAVGQGLDNGRRSLRGLIQNQCGVSCATIACSDVTEGNETQKPIAKDAVGQGLDNGKFWFGPLLEGVIDRGPKSARRDCYTMNVSYNVTDGLMKIDSFLSEEDVA